MSISVGQKVKYVPSLDFAYNRDLQRNFPWTFAAQVRNFQGKLESRELTTDELKKFLKGQPNGTRLKEVVTPVKPRIHWDAVVMAVHEDGSADVDVQFHLPGVTQSLERVFQGTAAQNIPNTFYVEV